MPGKPTGVAVPDTLLDVVRSDELNRLDGERVQLSAQVQEMRPRVQSLEARLAAAEEAWEHAGEHTLSDAEALTLLKEEAPKMHAQLAEVEQRLAGVEGQMRLILEGDARGRAHKRGLEVWPPTCRALAGPVRELLSALQAQQSAWNQLYSEQATGIIEQGTNLSSEEYLISLLERWLAAVERAGYLTR